MPATFTCYCNDAKCSRSIESDLFISMNDPFPSGLLEKLQTLSVATPLASVTWTRLPPQGTNPVYELNIVLKDSRTVKRTLTFEKNKPEPKTLILSPSQWMASEITLQRQLLDHLIVHSVTLGLSKVLVTYV